MHLPLPQPVLWILSQLNQQGFEAQVVGGCVRDLLLGLAPQDYDICTSAPPDAIKACFSAQKVLETGLKHGTLTLLLDGCSYELTTYRSEGPYSDGRRPDFVKFGSSLSEDLARRDFTIGAMAYHPKQGLFDPFFGQEDLENGLIRAVGDPAARFLEDALRMLRALRFSARFGFSIEPQTAKALRAGAASLPSISAERLQNELSSLLVAPHVGPVLLEYGEVLSRFLPELAPMFGFEQNNPHHTMDVWQHSVAALCAAPPLLPLRLALLLHDSGKPLCYTEDEAGIGHFYGHPAISEQLAKAALLRLKFDKACSQTVLTLIRHHSDPILPERKPLKRLLCRFGAETARLMVAHKQADAMGLNPAIVKARCAPIQQAKDLLEALIAEEDCFSLSSLAVNGEDLLGLGLKRGPEVGRLLDLLLQQVLDEQLPNEREALLAFAQAHIP